MRFPRRVTYSLLLALVLGTVLLRYPLDFSHEVGSDTTFIHSLADSLVTTGNAAWILHPTSYFGFYALSYPSAMPFLLAEIHLVSSVPIEGAILLTGILFGVCGALGSFLAARAAKADDRFALLVAFLFSTAPFFVKGTTWIGSSRGVVTALVPVLFALLLLHLRTADVRHLLLSALLILTMSAFHRMGMLTLFVLVAYLFVIPFHRITQRLRFVFYKYEALFRKASTGTAVVGFFAVFYLQFLFPGVAGSDVTEQYGSGFFHGSSFPILVGNMAISLSGKVGLLLPFLTVGLFRFAAKRPKEARDKFLLVLVFAMIPMLSLRDYIGEFLVYIFAILVALAFFPNRQNTIRASTNHKKAVLALAVTGLLVAGSSAFSWFMKDYWRDRYYNDGPVPDDLYSTSVYVMWQTNGTVISNEGMSAGRLAAFSSHPVLPIGGASIHWFGPQQLTFGFVKGSQVSAQAIPLTSISFQTDEIFVPVGVPNAKDDYEAIFSGSTQTWTVKRDLLRYNVHFVFVLDSHLEEFQSYIWRPSLFLRELPGRSYKLYDVGSHSLWYIG